MDAHNVGPRPLNLLRGNGTDHGIVAVDGGCNTAPHRGRETLVAGCPSPGGVAQITGHKEVLVGSGTGQRGDRGHQCMRGLRRGTVGDTGNVGDLNDVGGTGEDGGGDGLGGLALGASSTELVVLLLLGRPIGSSRADDEPPDEEQDDGEGSHTTNNTSRDGTGVGLLRGRAVRGLAVGIGNTLGGGTFVAGRTRHRTGFACFAGWACRGAIAAHAALEEGVGGGEAGEGLEIGAFEKHIGEKGRREKQRISTNIDPVNGVEANVQAGIKECSRLRRRQVVSVEKKIINRKRV